MAVSYTWDVDTDELASMQTYALYKEYGIKAKVLVKSLTFTIKGVGSYTYYDSGKLCYAGYEDIYPYIDSYRVKAEEAKGYIKRLEAAQGALAEAWSGDAAGKVDTRLLRAITTLKRQQANLEQMADCAQAFISMCGEFRSKYKWDSMSNYTYG